MATVTTSATATGPGPKRPRLRPGRAVLLAVLLCIVLIVLFWDWDWFIPLVEARASAALGRRVTIEHLHVRLGLTTRIAATGIAIADPEGFPTPAGTAPDLATIGQLAVAVDIPAYFRDGALTLPWIALDTPRLTVRQRADGTGNYTLDLPRGGAGKPPRIGLLVIRDGLADIKMAKFRTDMEIAIHTEQVPGRGDLGDLYEGQAVLASAKGTYSGAPITGSFRGGALLSLRDPAHPYPVELQLANGSTQVSLSGTIDQPMTFGGARLKLALSGQDMGNLYPLTGIPLPATPPYRITGDLTYAKDAIRFDNFYGRVGTSDLEGDLADEIPASGRPRITANLSSHRVDLTDLAGFLNGTPGKPSTPGQTAATRARVEQADASPRLLPDQPFDLPKLNMADFEVHYRGARIINRDVPLDNMVAWLSIEGGRITLHPLNFAVGSGAIASDIDLNPVAGVLHSTANIDFRELQLSRLMAATRAFTGDGTVGGSAHLTGTGNSLAAVLGHGNGSARLFMNHGGDISALLVDLAGLQAGDAVLSALGLPRKATIRCLVSDFTLTDGQLKSNAFLIATTEANILGSGTANLTEEKLNLALWTEATHFSIGSLSTPITIGGTLKHPSVLPAPGPLAARAAPAIGLGVLFPPLALIPTIRLGLGDKNACEDTLRSLAEGRPHNPS